jgi:hypothetical protein
MPEPSERLESVPLRNRCRYPEMVLREYVAPLHAAAGALDPSLSRIYGRISDGQHSGERTHVCVVERGG